MSQLVNRYIQQESRFYRLRIRLLDSDPEIWRSFYVPGLTTLDRLHDVIQIVMGWEDYHLHEFTIGKNRYTENPESVKEHGKDEGHYCLLDLIRQKGRTFQYWYDFGDDWQHEICIESSNYIPRDPRYLFYCLDGARACPPEDVGGVYGYEGYLKTIGNPEDPEYHETFEWRGEFDSEKFDRHGINMKLLEYTRWSRDRKFRWMEIIVRDFEKGY